MGEYWVVSKSKSSSAERSISRRLSSLSAKEGWVMRLSPLRLVSAGWAMSISIEPYPNASPWLDAVFDELRRGLNSVEISSEPVFLLLFAWNFRSVGLSESFLLLGWNFGLNPETLCCLGVKYSSMTSVVSGNEFDFSRFLFLRRFFLGEGVWRLSSRVSKMVGRLAFIRRVAILEALSIAGNSLGSKHFEEGLESVSSLAVAFSESF
mmetsp:Transcript_16127/g.33280  ORF Transcript_16127/g.33280 Transcript_16127/m.33280 type:complete len:208 (+) Transcript_16127:297-920(+)